MALLLHGHQATAASLMEPGLRLSAAETSAMQAALIPLNEAIHALQEPDHAWAKPHMPDVLVFQKAVSEALEHNEFHARNQIQTAHALIAEGLARAAHLLNGRAPWLREKGCVVRGFRSRLDDSIQPYGLVIPETWDPDTDQPFRLDVWLHGRDNKLSELKFIDQRQRSKGTFAPDHTIVLHPYGRFCNAFKFAGESDVFEAMEALEKHYSIDQDRISIRGFSMGGAGCWHLAVHHADRWAAAAPGAGFAESADYLSLWKKEIKPLWYETDLWNLYDADAYALNLYHLPTIAYSGGDDKQIQAARMMEKAMEAEGMQLAHLIGPDTGHRYHPDTRVELDEKITQIVARGKEKMPKRVRLVTHTLRYGRMHWVQLEGLEHHWKRAEVDARMIEDIGIRLETENVTGLSLNMPPGSSLLRSDQAPVVTVDGQRLVAPRVASDRSWQVSLSRDNGQWGVVKGFTPPAGQWRKAPGLQGPIDDAFMDRFVVVKPSGQARRSYADRWARREMDRLTEQWRSQFRGDALQVLDLDFKQDDWKDAHWILFGTPETNAMIKRLMPYLPIEWQTDQLVMGTHRFDAARHVPVMVYPNPINPGKYVVINSAFTFRGFGSNATQIPMLPDYAVIDSRTRATDSSPGRVLLAGFFDESWQFGF